MGKVIDVIHNTAVATYEEKKTIDLDDPSHKDVMSVLRRSFAEFIYPVDDYFSVNANKRATKEDRLPENEVISQMG